MGAAIPFAHRLGGHCASSALRDLFEFKGLRFGAEPASEGLLFGLGAGLDVLFFPRAQRDFPFYLGGRRPGFEDAVLARVGGHCWRRAEPDDAAAWEYVRGRLDAGEPVPLVADCQKLSYLRTRASMPQHVIVLAGYTEAHALVADNDRPTLVECTLESLREARRSRGFPLPAMNVTLELTWPAALPPLGSLVGPALREQARWFRAPSGPAIELLGGRHFAFEALGHFEALVAQWRAQEPENGNAVAATLWLSIEKAGTGGGLFRRLYRDFLAESAEAAPTEPLRAAHAHYEDLAARWASLGQRAAGGFAPALAEELAALCAAEREGVTLLERAADSLGA